MKGVIPTAAERSRCDGACVRSACKKDKKFAESSGEIVLQPTPCLLGYSQLKFMFGMVMTEDQDNVLEINTIQPISVDKTQDCLHEGGPILLCSHSS